MEAAELYGVLTAGMSQWGPYDGNKEFAHNDARSLHG